MKPGVDGEAPSLAAPAAGPSTEETAQELRQPLLDPAGACIRSDQLMLQFMQIEVSSAHGPVLLLILHVGRTGLPDDHSTSAQPAAATIPVQPAIQAPPAAPSYAAAAARAWPSYPAPPIAPVRHL